MMLTQTDRRSKRRLALLLLLALLHLSLWFWVDGRLRAKVQTPEAHRRSELRLVTLRLPPLPKPVVAPVRVAAGTPTPRISQRQAMTQPAEAVSEPIPEAPAPFPVQASASAPGPALLSSDATRRVLREAGKSPLLSERAAAAMGDGAPIGPEEKLGQQIKQAAVGDCLKGEFAGAGAGLLSVPFWLLAEARGKCRR